MTGVGDIAFLPTQPGGIRQAISRAIADKGRTIRLPVYVNTALNRIRRERQRLLQELGREPTEFELAEATGLDPIRMVELQAAPRSSRLPGITCRRRRRTGTWRRIGRY